MISLRKVAQNTLADFAIFGVGRPPRLNPAWSIDRPRLRGVEIHFPREFSYYLAATWGRPLSRGFRRDVTVRYTDVRQSTRRDAPILCRWVERGRGFDFAIDFSDTTTIHRDIAAGCSVYFKMQYEANGYGLENVIPGGYVTESTRLYLHLRSVRALGNQRSFDHDVCGRFNPGFAASTRARAIGILDAQDRFRFEGGMSKLAFRQFLREIARSKIVVDLPGNGPFCHRLINYLAVGACIVAHPHATRFPVPLEDRKNIAYVNPDLSDLVETCEFYLNHPTERDALCAESRRYFDDNLHHANLSRYYLKSIADRIAV